MEGLVKPGQNKNLMSTTILRWESTTTAGTLIGILEESGATPLIQISDGNTALSHGVEQSQRVVNVRKLALHLVDTILEKSMSQQAEGLVKTGQCHSLMRIAILMWESTTTAGILLGILVESGATPLIQISGGSSALFQFVMQHTTVRKVIR